MTTLNEHEGDKAHERQHQKRTESTDIARLFAEDVKRYANAVGSLDDLSATNAYNVLKVYEREDSFNESMKGIERINRFETELAKSEYLLTAIRIHDRLLRLSDETLKSIRMQICLENGIDKWDL